MKKVTNIYGDIKISYFDEYGNDTAFVISINEHDLVISIGNTKDNILTVVLDRDCAFDIANDLIDMYMKEVKK